MSNSKTFHFDIANSKQNHSWKHRATIELPAGWWEYVDALDKAHVTEDSDTCNLFILGAEVRHIQLSRFEDMMRMNFLAEEIANMGNNERFIMTGLIK